MDQGGVEEWSGVNINKIHCKIDKIYYYKLYISTDKHC